MHSLLPVAQWRSLFADPPGPLRQQLQRLYGPDAAEISRRTPWWADALEGFARTYRPDAEVFLVRAPGRVNLLGTHIDHRGGAVNTLAVGDTIFVVQPRDDDSILLANADGEFPARSFRISAELPADGVDDWDRWTLQQHRRRVEASTQADWSNYVRAAVLYLQHLRTAPGGRFAPALKGMNVFVNSNLRPRSGLSSSSAIVMASLEACAHLNRLGLSDLNLATLGHQAEWYVGTRGGGGDHAAIKFARQGNLAHLGSLPLTVELIPFPADCCAVLCDSGVVAAKTAGARNQFNQRVASYELGMLMLRKSFPRHAARMKLLRDVNGQTLGLDEGAIYQMLKALPEAADREQLSAMLADQPAELERVFRSHEPAPGGYRIRQACLYGIAECLRSQQACELLGRGDIAGFGRLMVLSHDGDRVSRLVDGQRVPLHKPLPDEELDRLTAEVRGDDPARREQARLYRQPGGYDASCPELDEMVDIALDVPGVLGAGLVGAGLGGSIVVLTARAGGDAIAAAMERHYYRPRGLPPMSQLCLGVGGCGVLHLE